MPEIGSSVGTLLELMHAFGHVVGIENFIHRQRIDIMLAKEPFQLVAAEIGLVIFG